MDTQEDEELVFDTQGTSIFEAFAFDEDSDSTEGDDFSDNSWE